VGVLYASVFAGGMLGGSLRYLIGLAMPAQPGRLPWGILSVNLVGAFLLGLLLGGWTRRGRPAHPWRPFLAAGVLGSFTTWSTFMADTQALAEAGASALAAGYLVTATAAGVAAAGLGWRTAARLVPVLPQPPGPDQPRGPG